MTLESLTLQPHLEDDLITLRPLKQEDFESLYAVASDPLVWEQHPNKDRYRREVFEIFFKGAMESKGALLAIDKESNKVVGCSRYYDLNIEDKSVFIGYTFLGRPYWGHTYNKSLKELMINHAFQFVSKITFHIGANNIRSQKAIGKLGATHIGSKEMQYYGEAKSNLNFVYQIMRIDWIKNG